MSHTVQSVAALIIFNGYRVAPHVTPCAPGYLLPCDRETQAFKQLTAYMARFKELNASGHTWEPLEFFNDGIALAPWLRGGARYLQSLLLHFGIDALAPERVPIAQWFSGIQALADGYALLPADKPVSECLHAVRKLWDQTYAQVTDARALRLDGYYAQAQNAMDKWGLESNAQRIAYMRRKNRIASIGH